MKEIVEVLLWQTIMQKIVTHQQTAQTQKMSIQTHILILIQTHIQTLILMQQIIRVLLMMQRIRQKIVQAINQMPQTVIAIKDNSY